MNPFSHTGLSISDSLKSVRKSVLIYETIIKGYIDDKTSEEGLSDRGGIIRSYLLFITVSHVYRRLSYT